RSARWSVETWSFPLGKVDMAATARPVAGADGMVGGGHAAVDRLAALHALRPCRWTVGRRGRPRSSGSGLRSAPHHGALAGREAFFQAGRPATQRAHRN